jgi:hypothetical protein
MSIYVSHVRLRRMNVVYFGHLSVYFYKWTTAFGECPKSILPPFVSGRNPYGIRSDRLRAAFPPAASCRMRNTD